MIKLEGGKVQVFKEGVPLTLKSEILCLGAFITICIYDEKWNSQAT